MLLHESANILGSNIFLGVKNYEILRKLVYFNGELICLIFELDLIESFVESNLNVYNLCVISIFFLIICSKLHKFYALTIPKLSKSVT